MECGIQNSPTPYPKVLPTADDDSGRIVGGADARPGEYSRAEFKAMRGFQRRLADIVFILPNQSDLEYF